jgi:hypothetical protein
MLAFPRFYALARRVLALIDSRFAHRLFALAELAHRFPD